MDNPFSAHSPLPAGFVLDVYRFDQVLGSPGAFGVTYAAKESRTGKRVAIKELFPRDFVVRDKGRQVVAQTQEDNVCFQDALRMFRYEADVLAQVKHENVVHVMDYFEANGTAYMVMAYEEGYDLGRHLAMQKPGRLNENELKKLIMPLLDGLEAVHNMNYLHRDLKPSNIYLTRSHKPLLLDFGAARQMVVSRSRPVTTILTAPYAPFEQYGTTIAQGPWTDIYALGSVMFEAILCVDDLPPSPNRLVDDKLVPISQRVRGHEYSEAFLKSIDWALRVRTEDRPQSIEDWRQAVTAKAQPPRFPFLGEMKNQVIGVTQGAGSAASQNAAVLKIAAFVAGLFLLFIIFTLIVAWMLL